MYARCVAVLLISFLLLVIWVFSFLSVLEDVCKFYLSFQRSMFFIDFLYFLFKFYWFLLLALWYHLFCLLWGYFTLLFLISWSGSADYWFETLFFLKQVLNGIKFPCITALPAPTNFNILYFYLHSVHCLLNVLWDFFFKTWII